MSSRLKYFAWWGTLVSMTRKVVARALPVLVGTVVILAAVVRGIVAPISGAGVLVTIIAALFGTGALLMARRDNRTVDEGPPVPAGPDPSEVDTPLVERANSKPNRIV